MRLPPWFKVRPQTGENYLKIRHLVKNLDLNTVCEEAQCPNIWECWNAGTATFMILGEICTRSCGFCNVDFGQPKALDPKEPEHVAEAVASLNLKHVVITSVDRDDLQDGGGQHIANVISAIRQATPATTIEVLTPDFLRKDGAIETVADARPDVFNHNLETVPRLYKQARPGSDYQWSLDLLRTFGAEHPGVPTKSGLMLGLGETIAEVEQVMHDLREHDVDMLTLGQYLQPSKHHLPVDRFVHPDEFEALREVGERLGFAQVASGPMVRSSYHADQQAAGLLQGNFD